MLNDHSDPITICSGKDAPLVQWRGKYDCQSEENEHSLFIQNLSYVDSGKYVCTEDGGRGPDRGHSEVLVSRKCASAYSFTTR